MADIENDDGKGYMVGRGKPPLHTRFGKGVSGNRRGRPKGSRQQIPFNEVLGRPVTVFEADGERIVEAAEAFLLYLRKRWAEGDSTARKLMTKVLHVAKQRQSALNGSGISRIIVSPVAPGSPNPAFLSLKMGVKQDALRPTAHIRIEPWLVQVALDRLGDRRLTRDEQTTIVKSTRTPNKVNWPDWWEVLP